MIGICDLEIRLIVWLYFNVRNAFVSHKEDLESLGMQTSQAPYSSIVQSMRIDTQEPTQSETMSATGISSLGRSSADEQRLIKSMRLPTLYPIIYILLWLPGLINRILKACGLSVQVMIILQSSVQFEGLANCILYGLTESKKNCLSDSLMFE
ncbi:hypothetical protein K493DRAFT_334457 [Basidiobolus meristosporus CBS 931.73]|uniref:Uncharacterized protein n=1 Tax=Basidiobolus meristosporus CBS 931.73 TaxID=1314790 RepID=A0A1Y1YZA3_9FUNG|nr:hypothetical protein K493DRAFT_334457 [Basidiobolus meristosporus CBS 931.73]|eukprot:ORY02895.1 hypothetical protein K493DRAFT_334457 [Basidiobolus meristosporus CBS 931.73]